MSERYEVCVVGGAGHVGAPLSVVLAAKGIRTLAHDVNGAALDRMAGGVFPFMEEGGDEMLRDVLANGTVGFSTDPASVAGIPLVIVTIGTPIDEFHNPKFDVVTSCVDRLLPHLTDDQTIILRSTVFPGVTEALQRHLRAQGRMIAVAFCPERVVQGRAITEILTLPQLVSGATQEAEDRAAEFFARIAPKVIRLRPQEAEFAKLISNAYRYITFAAANQFYMMVEAAGLDYKRVLVGIKDDYPRMRDLPGPGFAAGPCLMKDTLQLAAFDRHPFELGLGAMHVNEGLPSFIVERLRARHDLATKTVGILGMAFKAENDDIRESLSYKLGKLLRFHGASVRYSDEYAKDETFVSARTLVKESDIVIIGVPHAAYRNLTIPTGVEVIDLWGIVPGAAGE